MKLVKYKFLNWVVKPIFPEVFDTVLYGQPRQRDKPMNHPKEQA
ncbi:MAG: hypothetical protein PHI97_12910 [Desulfobulbus sp.]|nr:hypothetical protein [Desulfobulbus sp.]